MPALNIKSYRVERKKANPDYYKNYMREKRRNNLIAKIREKEDFSQDDLKYIWESFSKKDLKYIKKIWKNSQHLKN